MKFKNKYWLKFKNMETLEFVLNTKIKISGNI